MNHVLLLLSLLLTLSRQLRAQPYLPLEVGNRWDYIASYFSWETHEGSRDTVMLRITGFSRQANGKEYFEFEQQGFALAFTRHIRVDAMRMLAYYEIDSTEEMYYRFDAEVAIPWSVTHENWMIKLRWKDTINVLGIPRSTVTFNRDGLLSDQITFAEGLGPSLHHFAGEPGGLRDDNITLVGCILSGLTYGELLVDVDRLQEIPETDLLLPAYPNPVRDATTLSFAVASPGPVTFIVVNTLGMVVTRFEREAKAGRNQVHWKRGDLPAGVYLLTLHGSAGLRTTKLVIAE